jgi:S1-C subfamily serine protease
MSVQKMYKRQRDSVVAVNSNYTDGNQVVQSLSGSGFLVRMHRRLYIVTAANLVFVGNAATPVTNIFVGVWDHHHKSHSVAAKVVGVDADANVAVLDLAQGHDYRRFCHHRRFEFARTSRVETGDAVFNIGFPLNRDTQTFVEGTVRDPHFMDPTGHFLAGLMVTNLLVDAGCYGSPTLNKYGEIVGILTFGASPMAEFGGEIGYSGGANSHTLHRILYEITEHRNSTNVPGGYAVNAKASLGNFSYVGVTNYNLSTLYPANYDHLRIRGVIVTQIDPTSPLANLLYNEPPLQVGDIIVWGQHRKHRIYFGNGQNEGPLGDLLYFINPMHHNDYASFGVIRTPNTNTDVTRIRVQFTATPAPSTEIVPSNFANRVLAPATPLFNELQFIGPVNIIDLESFTVMTTDSSTLYDKVIQSPLNPNVLFPARLSNGRLFYLNTPLSVASDVISTADLGAPIPISEVTFPADTPTSFQLQVNTSPLFTILTSHAVTYA